MSHAVIRTSPIGSSFIGRCDKCGEEGLGLGGALINCPADDSISDEQTLLDLLEMPTSNKKGQPKLPS